MKKLRLFLVSLAVLSVACQPQQPANPSASNPSSPASAGRIMTITSETNDPKLPKILVPGLELKVFAGSGKAGYKDGPKLEAEFDGFSFLTADTNFELYINDANNECIRKISTTGLVSTIAGSGKELKDYSQLLTRKGDPLKIDFHLIKKLAFIEPGVLFISDAYSIFQLSLKQNNVTEVLEYHKSDFESYTPNTIPIHLQEGVGCLVPYRESLLLCQNQEIKRLSFKDDRYQIETFTDIRPGNLSNIIGNPSGLFRDGPVKEAIFKQIGDLAFDRENNIYIADIGNHRIRKLDIKSQMVTTISGKANLSGTTSINPDLLGGYKDGPSTEALFDGPYDLEILENDILLVADGNKALRAISEDWVYTLISNISSGPFLKQGSRLYLTDSNTQTIYTLDLSNLTPEKLRTMRKAHQ
ncbi:MAG: hypothetical protein AB7I41_01620 [Candidatus Sericytochromatia bacterium]